MVSLQSSPVYPKLPASLIDQIEVLISASGYQLKCSLTKVMSLRLEEIYCRGNQYTFNILIFTYRAIHYSPSI